MLFCRTVLSLEDFSILAKSSGSFKLEIQESVLTKFLKQKLGSFIISKISSLGYSLFYFIFCSFCLDDCSVFSV